MQQFVFPDVHLVVRIVHTGPVMKISSSLKTCKSTHARAWACVHTRPYCVHEFAPWNLGWKKRTVLGKLGWSGEWGSGLFSGFCFGVRLSGDRASINGAEHLGSLKPERVIQFINLNLLMLELDRDDLWETLTEPRCSPFSCTHTHQQSYTAPPPTSSAPRALGPLHFGLLHWCLNSI